MSKLRVFCTFAVPVVLAPLIATVSPPASAAPLDFCGLSWVGQEKFVWDGSTGDDRWDTAANWEDNQVPDLVDAENGYVCINAAADLDPDDDVVYLVPEARNLDPETVEIPNSAMIQAIDVASGTLSINRTGKLYLYGDPRTRPSFIRPGARLELTMGTLGGGGRLNMDGKMVWTAAQFSSSTLKSSCEGIAGDRPGDPPSPPDTLPQFCPPSAERPNASGRLVVGGSLTIRGGAFDASGNLTDDGLERGVNLAQRYGISVATGGEVHVAGDAYLTQSHTATIDIENGGEWIFDGDGDVYEGFFEGTPNGPLPPFLNEGAVTKASGTGSSSIDTAYEGFGSVTVDDGALTTPGGFPGGVAVRSGDSLGSWDCPAVEFGAPASDCLFDNAADSPVTSPQDLQAVQLTTPESARIQVVETDVAGTRDLQPPIQVSGGGGPTTDVSTLDFEFNNRISRLPDKPRLRIYRRAGAATWRAVPRCKEGPGSPFPNGVTACTRAPRDRAGGGLNKALRLTVITTNPVGAWVLRSDRRIVVARADGRFGADAASDLGVSALRLPASPDGHCAASQPVDWTVRRELVGRATDDHALGWWPSARGRARGFQVPVDDLVDLDAFALRLDVVRGNLRGYIRVVRNETTDIAWIAQQPVLQTDADPIGGRWLLVQGGDVSYTWRRYSGGVRDGTPAYVGTIAEFAADHPAKSTGAGPDRVGYAFGCARERVLVNDLTLRVADDSEPVVWDLEVPQARVQIVSGDIGDECQLSRRSWRNRVTRSIRATEGAPWDVTWRPADPTTRWRLLEPRVRGVGGGSPEIQLPAQKGLLQAILRRSNRFRVDGSAVVRFKAVPVMRLRAITRTTERKVLRVGHRITLRGQFAPGGPHEVRLWRTAPGGRELRPTNSFARVRKGRFALGFKPTVKGRYAFAVQYGGSVRLNGAISNRAFFTTVRAKLPPAQPLPPAPPQSEPPPADVTNVNNGIERQLLLRARTCVYLVGR